MFIYTSTTLKSHLNLLQKKSYFQVQANILFENGFTGLFFHQVSVLDPQAVGGLQLLFINFKELRVFPEQFGLLPSSPGACFWGGAPREEWMGRVNELQRSPFLTAQANVSVSHSFLGLAVSKKSSLACDLLFIVIICFSSGRPGALFSGGDCLVLCTEHSLMPGCSYNG